MKWMTTFEKGISTVDLRLHAGARAVGAVNRAKCTEPCEELA